MLSRVADSLHWMSRYLERAEHTTCNCAWNSPRMKVRADALLEALQVAALPGSRIDATALAEIAVLDRSNPSSIVSCISAVRRPAQRREQCSSEMWEQLNRLYLQMNSTAPGEGWLLHSHLFFRAVQEGAHLFHEITDSTMGHGEVGTIFNWGDTSSAPTH